MFLPLKFKQTCSTIQKYMSQALPKKINPAAAKNFIVFYWELYFEFCKNAPFSDLRPYYYVYVQNKNKTFPKYVIFDLN